MSSPAGPPPEGGHPLDLVYLALAAVAAWLIVTARRLGLRAAPRCTASPAAIFIDRERR